MGVNIRVTSGPAIERPGDLAALLTNLNRGDVLFIDEIHRLPRLVEEILYPAMEDFALDIIIGKGPGARSLRLDLPPLYPNRGYGAGRGPLLAPAGSLRRSQPHGVLHRPGAGGHHLPGGPAASGGAGAGRGAGDRPGLPGVLPGSPTAFLKRVRDYAQIRAGNVITGPVAREALQMLELDRLGLDEIDRRLLATVIDKFQGGPVGLDTLAAAINEEPETLEDVYEPYLMKLGFLKRTPRGRVVTGQAYKYLGRSEGPAQDPPAAPLLRGGPVSQELNRESYP